MFMYCSVIDGAKAMNSNNPESNISHLVGHVEAFKMKLRLFDTCLENNDFHASIFYTSFWQMM